MRDRRITAAVVALSAAIVCAGCELIMPHLANGGWDAVADGEGVTEGSDFDVEPGHPDDGGDTDGSEPGDDDAAEGDAADAEGDEVSPLCGNGDDSDPGEECDDGRDGDPDDGCRDDCLFSCHNAGDCIDADICNGEESCVFGGAGKLCQGGTALGDGTFCGDVPRSICRGGVCKASTCGDGFVDTGGDEDCEPPSAGGCTAGCRWGCTGLPADCPDDTNACNGEEYCDTAAHECARRDAPETGTLCASDPRRICVGRMCQESVCGDGYADGAAAVPEECDDGRDGDPDDGCRDTCLYTCHNNGECDDGRVCTEDNCDLTPHTCGHVLCSDETLCRASSGTCDPEERCDGTGADCPADALAASGSTCRPVAGVCDVPEACTGTAAGCPGDEFIGSATVCRSVAGVCDVQESCTGAGAHCPLDAFLSGTLCRASAGVCDPEERCEENGPACTGNSLSSTTVVCRSQAGVCDVPEKCTGSTPSCPTDILRTTATVCRSSAGVCDVAESCTGTSAACPADTLLAGVVCRSVSGYCDIEESCAGTSAACPPDHAPPPFGGIARIAGGLTHTCAVSSSGWMTCWGGNISGQLGIAIEEGRTTPVDVIGLSSGVSAIAAGHWHTCAVAATGRAMCWGQNTWGELGDSTGDNKFTPVNVYGLLSGVSAVAAGYHHSCGIVSGAAKCWGRNEDGQLGDATKVERSTPVDVIGLSAGIMAITAGHDHSCAVDGFGTITCWGRNSYGQLGDGTLAPWRTTPVDVAGAVQATTVAAGNAYHTCALLSAGGVTCWGRNDSGQVGDGTTTQRSTPTSVIGLSSNVAQVAVGIGHSCALLSAGGVVCWGNNSNGQLGDATTTSRSTPVSVIGLSSGASAIGAGAYHSCAVLSTGGVKCWGRGDDGQLGDGSTTGRSTPVDVVCGL